MSTVETRTPLHQAKAIGLTFCALIEDACEQLCIGGSVRRGLPDVGDLEVVAVAKTSPVLDMFGEPTGALVDHLAVCLADLESAGAIARHTPAPSWGPLHKRIAFMGMVIDLYGCEPGRWGWVLALRTGPAEFTRRLVVDKDHYTKDGRSGLMPAHLRFEGGWLTSRTSGQRIATPTEEDLFDALGLPCLPPERRR